MTIDKEHAELLAIQTQLTEKHERERSEHLQQQAWINEVLEAWDDKKYRTFGEFMASPAGLEFKRRYYEL